MSWCNLVFAVYAIGPTEQDEHLTASWRVEECNCVVVGTFNIYLFQPGWLCKVCGLPKDSEFELEGDFSQPGFLVRKLSSDTQWIIRPDRLIVASSDEDCGEILEKVLRAIPVTPVRAVGSNFRFSMPSHEAPSDLWVLKHLWPEDKRPKCEILHSALVGAFLIDDARHHVSIAKKQDELQLNINVTRDVTDASLGAEAALKFNDDKIWAQKFSVDLLTEIKE